MKHSGEINMRKGMTLVELIVVIVVCLRLKRYTPFPRPISDVVSPLVNTTYPLIGRLFNAVCSWVVGCDKQGIAANAMIGPRDCLIRRFSISMRFLLCGNIRHMIQLTRRAL